MKRIRTGDQYLVKQINKSIVFETIKEKAPISRAQISKETSLNKATVSTMVSELLEDSFIYEIGEGQSSGGRKPILLYFNNHAGYSIGIDLGVNYLLGILTDLKGNIIEEMRVDLLETELSYVTDQLFTVIQTLIDKAPESPYGIIGIGIGVPGLVNQKTIITFAPNLKWKHIDLKEIVGEKFQLPVQIENEANAGALGERVYGSGIGIANQIYVSIGVGIGTGIIINNDLYKGSTGVSGEMGHFTIDMNGRKCSCGNRGCWELYASERALLEAAEQMNLKTDLSFLLNEAKMGNPKVLQLLTTLGENIGYGLINIINTFNPSVIIIGNRISMFQGWMTNPIEHVLKDRLSIYQGQEDQIEIRYSNLNHYSTALGATSFSIAHFFNKKI
ncbi:ROK family protein [Bacillus sp. FJAT-27251]|uniref:ROK family protein n=1 Tax=Bacillus sp. FJAT-27251 TaxID=1684142 RepID=UPI0006A7D7C4|nr:ROK family protein [Bacillus sp. FJAT-27251]